MTREPQQAVTQAVTQKVDSAALRAGAGGGAAGGGHPAGGASRWPSKVKQTGYQQADSLTAKAGDNPLLQAAAKPAADKLRKETDTKAAGIVSEASKRADSLVAAARRQATSKP